MSHSVTFDLKFPSVLGFERVARDLAASVGKIVGLPEARLEDLKTAVAEACLNAIEHGNKLDPDSTVRVRLTAQESALEVVVRDSGPGPGEVNPPSIEAKLSGEDRTRGWGVFLIKSLMDEVSFESGRGGGSLVRMSMRLSPAPPHTPSTD